MSKRLIIVYRADLPPSRVRELTAADEAALVTWGEPAEAWAGYYLQLEHEIDALRHALDRARECALPLPREHLAVSRDAAGIVRIKADDFEWVRIGYDSRFTSTSHQAGLVSRILDLLSPPRVAQSPAEIVARVCEEGEALAVGAHRRAAFRARFTPEQRVASALAEEQVGDLYGLRPRSDLKARVDALDGAAAGMGYASAEEALQALQRLTSPHTGAEPFARLFYAADVGQVLVVRDADDDRGPVLKISFQPEGLGVCSLKLNFSDSEAGDAQAAQLFAGPLLEERALEAVRGAVQLMRHSALADIAE